MIEQNQKPVENKFLSVVAVISEEGEIKSKITHSKLSREDLAVLVLELERNLIFLKNKIWSQDGR